MTQKEKKLLLKDLCTRSFYGVMCDRLGQAKKLLSVSPDRLYCIELDNGEYAPSKYKVEDVKPYLRPMSSMTEEEKEEWHDTFDSVQDYVPEADDYDDNWHEQPGIESYDWLNEHHFDYRGLIPMGLALEALEGMYK